MSIEKHHPDVEHEEGHNPGYGGGIDGGEEGPFPAAAFAAYGGEHRHAGKIEQHKGDKG